LFWQSRMGNLYVSEDHDHCFDSLEWTIYMLARIMAIALFQTVKTMAMILANI
jgi:hypothetical protein